jgi:hypothetical protein
MPQYYCYQCAISHNLISPVDADSLNLTGTSYQLGKYIKHTSSPSGLGIVSIFDDPAYDTYRGYIVTGTISGMLEIDDSSRKNFIWYGGNQTGFEYRDNNYVAPVSGIKIVLVENDQAIHAFPVRGYSGLIYYCQICGNPLPQW